jgi:tRNA(fMet)-specific endonuclease VapC
VVRAELEAGAWGSRDPHGALGKVDRFFAPHVCLPFDDLAAEAYGRIVGALRRKGIDVGTAASMIAAIARAHDLTIVTRNLRHFRRIPQLRVTRW